MKKFLFLFVSIVMMLNICGCTNTFDEKDVRGEIVDENSNQNTNDTENIENTEDAEFLLGKTKNNKYENDFLGISCTLPSDWVFYTEEQILALNNIAFDYFDEETSEILKNATIIYDMYATNMRDGSNMNINLEKLNAIQLKNLDIKQVLESQIDRLKTGLQNMGYTDINIEYEIVNVDDRLIDGLKITGKISNADYYGYTLSFKKGNYLANISIFSFQIRSTVHSFSAV